MLKLIPIGGLGEIGLNMMVVEYDNTVFIIDSGVMFPENNMFGIDYIIPNMEYLDKNKKKISAIILTHAHEDHIGAIPFFLKKFNVPVFGTRFTLELAKQRLKKHNFLSNIKFNVIHSKECLTIGPFEIEFIKVNHSVIDGIGLAINTPIGTIIHTGDFKINLNNINKINTDIKKFAQYGKNGVLALLSDSTNVEKNGYGIPTKEVIDELTKIIEKSKGRIIIALFSSNISRIQEIINIAKIKNRKIVFNGKSIETNVEIAEKFGYLSNHDNIKVNIKKINSIPDKKLIIITTGSQGEPMSVITRMASGTHKHINVKNNDTIIFSSKFIPGNEKAIINIINDLYKRGANVIYEKISNIHTSGHAFKEELKLMINLTNPRFFMPIHGEYRHLIIHCRLAQEIGIQKKCTILAQNGQVVELSKYNYKKSKKINFGKILIDGGGIGDIGKNVIKERKILSEDGFVAINIIIAKTTGNIINGPNITSKGFVFEIETGHVLNDAQCIVIEIIESIHSKTINRIDKIKLCIKSTLRQYFFHVIKRKPIILPFLTEI